MPAKKRIVLWTILFLLLLTAIAASVPGVRGRTLGWWRGEAFFAGRPASLWSAELDGDAEAAEHSPAFDELKAGGKPAVPVLIAIAFSESPARHQARALLALQGDAAVGPLSKILAKGSATDRRQAALALGDMGRHAKAAVPALARLLDDDDPQTRRAALGALENIGSNAVDAVPDLMLILEKKGADTGTDWLAHAARALGKMGPSARQAVPALTGCLKSADPRLGSEACTALALMGKEAAPAVPPLIELLRSRRPGCAAAATALGKIGPEARQAVPALIELLQGDNSSEVREAAKIALACMGASAGPAVPVLLRVFGRAAPITELGSAAIPELVQLLANPAPGVQADTRFFLLALRKHAVPALLEAAQKDKNPLVRQRALAVLGPEWGEASTMVPVLIRALADKDSNVRGAARDGILSFHKDAQPFLDQQLRGKDPLLRLEAIQLLGRLGPDVRTSAGALLLVLKDDEPSLHLVTVRALAAMSYHPKEAVPVLIDALQAKDLTVLPLLAAHGRGARDALFLVGTLLADPDWKVRRQAVHVLERAGIDKEVGLPALSKVLADKEPKVRAGAARALGTARILSDEVVPVLIKVLQDPVEEVQAAGILALGQFGRASRAAVPLIHKIARTSKNDLRAACATALGGIGPPAQESAPLLLSWLVDTTSGNLRLLVARALGEIRAKAALPVLEGMLGTKDERSIAAALALWRIQESPPALVFLQERLKQKPADEAAIVALGQVGPAAHKSVPALTEILLRDPDLHQRARAAEALGRIGPAARPAIKVLIQNLRMPNPLLRASAASALAQFDEDAGDASARLVELLNDPESPEVRQAAADALLRIDPEAAANAGIE